MGIANLLQKKTRKKHTTLADYSYINEGEQFVY